MKEIFIKLGINTDEVKLQKAVYYKKKNRLSVFLLSKNNLEETQLQNIEKLLKEKFEIEVKVSYKKAVLDIDVVNYVIKSFITNKCATLCSFLNKEDTIVLLNESPKIIFKMTESVKEIFEKNGFIENLHKELDNYFFEEFEIAIEIKADSIPENILEERSNAVEKVYKEVEKGYFKVTNCEKYIGDNVNLFTKVSAIEDLSLSAEISVCCGKIKYFTKRSFEKIVKDQKKTKEYYTFTIDDGRTNIGCTIFSTEQTKAKLEKLVDGNKIIAVGGIEMFRDKLNFKPKNILFCEDFFYVEPKKVFNGVADNYQLILPSPYLEMKQIDLLVASDEDKSTYADNKTFVVFDVETTGLNYLDSQVIEIGAVKIFNGKIVETFSTLIKPDKFSISDEITAITGITLEMVENSPVFADVISDFFRFCSGAILVAHNADFDISFIKHESMECNYCFDNEVLDTLALSRQFIKGVKNYKLKTLVDFLAIDLENAHRASNDALATAKLFLHLSKFM